MRSLYRSEIMAFTIILITAFIVASVNASFVWQDDDDFTGKHDFKFHKNFPNFPKFPAFPTFPPFPQFTFPTPTFPTMPPIVFMTPEDIAKKKGPNFNGISISSSSSSTVDKDGKVIESGVGTIITNNGGVIKKYTFGEDPSNIKVVSPPPIVIPQVPIWQPIVPILPLEPEVLRTYKPGKNENFFGTSSVSYSQASNVNGVKTSAGGASILSNVNGDIAQKTALFGENEV